MFFNYHRLKNTYLNPNQNKKSSLFRLQRLGFYLLFFVVAIQSMTFFIKFRDNRHNFDITTKIFLRRLFGVFLICKSNFLKFGIPKIRRGKGKRLKDDPFDKTGIFMNYNQNEVDFDGRNNVPDLYGPMWLTGTYMIMLMICANLNDYFISANDQYIFNTDYCPQIIGIVFIYSLAESLVYKAVIGCLKGNIRTSQVIFLLINLEYMSGGLCTCLVFHSNYFLYHSITLCSYNSSSGRRAALRSTVTPG